jgi:hypothetical protein
MGDDFDSTCSTPFASVPSSLGRAHDVLGGSDRGYFFTAPAIPIHHLLLSSSCSASATPGAGDAEFEFGGPMISVDELFHNGQIRPLTLPLLLDLNPGSDDDGGGDRRPAPTCGHDLTPRCGSVHRRAL